MINFRLYSLCSKKRSFANWILIFACISLLVSCILVSSKKPFWNDELYSWYFFSDISFHEMLIAFGDTINNSPFLYFGLGWIWSRVFGTTELSLRLFTSFSVCIAFIVTWYTLRKSFSFWAASIGCLSVFCTSQIVLSQNAEARMYGLFLLTAAASLFIYDFILQVKWQTNNLYAYNFLAHAAMIHTHLFGLFYSFAFLFAFLLTTSIKSKRAYFKNVRGFTISVMLAWLSFVLYLPSFLVQSEAGRPYSWLPKPILDDLVAVLFLLNGSFLRFEAIGLVFVFALLYYLASLNAPKPNPIIGQHFGYRKTGLILFALASLNVPIFTWAFSVLIRPIFFERYLMPSILSWSILMAFLAEVLFCRQHAQLFKSAGTRSIISYQYLNLNNTFRYCLLPLTLSLIFISVPVIYGLRYVATDVPGSKDAEIADGNLPIVTQISHDFLERHHYSPDPSRYIFILDMEANSAQSSGLFGIQEQKHMSALKRRFTAQLGPYILTSHEFLQKHNDFLILDHKDYVKQCPSALGISSGLSDIHCPQWLEKRLLGNPDYRLQELAEVRDRIFIMAQRL